MVKFGIKNINMLWSVSKQPELYKPVYKMGDGEWRRIENQVSITISENILDLDFDFMFGDESECFYFAFSYPFSYSQC